MVWHRFGNSCAAVISCGQSVSGTIGTALGTPPWGIYSFSASANDVVTVRVRQTSGGGD